MRFKFHAVLQKRDPLNHLMRLKITERWECDLLSRPEREAISDALVSHTYHMLTEHADPVRYFALQIARNNA